ncbi:glycoside hydrolase family 13 protein [Shewanella sp. AS16]|uniref:glycoside hydrolase family 13 protein n=1 Tax=Shewanella sp. AS16 TaxID=2907625 RepID=UPI001F311F91|nr:glycoside hydrolase family 13 protein [Shewanella sp. AS16]
MSLLFTCLVLASNNDAIPKPATQAGEFVPEWAKSVVWYQIFPERFRDGDATNNPELADILGADPVERPKQWHIHPWGSDWYQRQDYELANGEPELWKHLLRRRYGGDLQGVIDKLGYLHELGITAIYLNPVFDSPSLHKYDGASYHHIDPNFGPDPLGDRALMAKENPLDPETWIWTKADELALQLIDKAHKYKMKIIFDGVFNHMGVNSFAFKDLKLKQQDSAYKGWFSVKSFDDAAAGTSFDYEGWFGVKSLPEWREDEHGIVTGPKEYIFNATRRWMNPKGMGTQFGIDGWRLDVAFEVQHAFWKDWRALVRSINPEAYMTAELVDKPEKVIPYFQGDEFDAEMNYNFAFTAAEFLFNPAGRSISVTQFDAKLKQLRELYPAGVAYVNQNLFGSHDTNRLASHIVNRGLGNFRDWGQYFNLSQAANNPEYRVRKPNSDEIRLQKLFVILQMTYVGAPMIYYGDEVGMWGGNDPDNRKPMLWPDIDYQAERYLPNGTERAPDKWDTVAINRDLLSHYKRLIAIRNQHAALRLGDFTSLLIDDKQEVYGFARHYRGETIWVLLNNSNVERLTTLTTVADKGMRDLMSQEMFQPQQGKLEVTIPAKWGRILKFE